MTFVIEISKSICSSWLKKGLVYDAQCVGLGGWVYPCKVINMYNIEVWCVFGQSMVS